MCRVASKKEGILETEEDLRNLKRTKLKKYFGSRNSNRIISSKLIKSVIWQAYTRIQNETEPGITGNLRTFWYRWVKPALAKVPKKYLGKMDHYDLMLRLFSKMVTKLELFRYADFDFTDENWENRRIGTTRPHVLVFAEKQGWIRILRSLHEEHGVSIIALGGFPSALTSEYTTRDLKKAITNSKPVRLIGIVDYDPSGNMIANSFAKQLQKTGLEIKGLQTIIHPKHYDPHEIELFRFPLPKKQPTKTRKWMSLTGGIDGEKYGLESESMLLDRLQALLLPLIEDE